MATITPTIERSEDGKSVTVTWEGLNSADLDGAPVSLPDFPDRSVQIIGTPDGATLTMQGSNNAVDYASLTDPQGNAIAKTAAALEQVMECPAHTRPLASGAGASTDLDVIMYCRR